jgi:hypothetical protein
VRFREISTTLLWFIILFKGVVGVPRGVDDLRLSYHHDYGNY